ncbi:MAG TPA: tRNA 2-thiouridine(34) synthase MnmA [Gemmatimonadota bacterium]|nr:tRNA 2-thiouridine(34) synthase MnmA [Gemmatimonadota bacterium]
MDTWKGLPCGARVLVAMSGGVDSSVAAATLVERGLDVVGVTMKNFCYSGVPEDHAATACCSLEAIEDARQVARGLGIVHHVLDFEGPFRDAVIDPFVADYAAGRTPNPCVRCNRFVRFPQLWRKARLLGAVGVATGHYARAVDVGRGRVELRRPVDRAKDQTFYLWGLSRALVGRALFPIGELTKDQVRDRAAELGLATAGKPESQDICFVADGDLKGFLAREAAVRPELAAAGRFAPGPIRDRDGRDLGTHPGSAYFTIGQRRGLGVAAVEPLYVTGIGGGNEVIVGTKDDLLAAGLATEDVNWLEERTHGFRAAVQIRHRAEAAPAWIRPRPGRRALVRFDEPQRAVAPGQSAVFYDGERLLGGGTICGSSSP